FLGFIMPSTLLAGPYLGDWGWCWHQARDCPRGDYSPLHYWTPGLYKLRAYVHPSNVDQYPPGPTPPLPVPSQPTTYPSRTLPAAPTAPYAVPAASHGR